MYRWYNGSIDECTTIVIPSLDTSKPFSPVKTQSVAISKFEFLKFKLTSYALQLADT